MRVEPAPGTPKAFIQYNGTAPVTSLYIVGVSTRVLVTAFAGFGVTDTDLDWTVSVGMGGATGGFFSGSGISGSPLPLNSAPLWLPAEAGDDLIVRVTTTSVVALVGFTLSGLIFPAN
jgi:hypothetical protein